MEVQVTDPAESVKYFQGKQGASTVAEISRELPASCPVESGQKHDEDQFEHLPLTRKTWPETKMQEIMHTDESGGGGEGGGNSPCHSR